MLHSSEKGKVLGLTRKVKKKKTYTEVANIYSKKPFCYMISITSFNNNFDPKNAVLMKGKNKKVLESAIISSCQKYKLTP